MNDSQAKTGVTLNKDMKDVLIQVCREASLVAKSDLNVEMRNYLDENKENYSTVLKGDFNGDKLGDIALLVKCKSKNTKGVRSTEKLAILLQEAGGKYRIIVLEEYPYIDDSIYLRAITLGKIIREFDSSKKIILRNIGIERIYFEKSSGVFYWENGQFHYIQTSD
jgi:hypothetical protein